MARVFTTHILQERRKSVVLYQTFCLDFFLSPTTSLIPRPIFFSFAPSGSIKRYFDKPLTRCQLQTYHIMCVYRALQVACPVIVYSNRRGHTQLVVCKVPWLNYIVPVH